ncbi:TPA: CZB domain-containing protein [Salmonella enterica subsp. enterica serovar Concord]|nr:CZB domain-containing protein [Salmonella enterica subsp. enterica serovar Concord]
MTHGNADQIFLRVYRMLQTKLIHSQYSTNKAIKFYRAMVEAADNNTAVINNTVHTLNRVYSLKKRISHKTEGLTGREKRYGKRIVSMLDDIICETENMDKQLLHFTGVMKGATDSLLMTILKAAHYQWRDRVYISVMSGVNTVPADKDNQCLLGWWYHNRGIQRFGGLPPFIRLGEVHRRLHVAASEIAREDLSEPDVSSVITKLDTFETVSQSVISALDELDEYLIKMNDWTQPAEQEDIVVK